MSEVLEEVSYNKELKTAVSVLEDHGYTNIKVNLPEHDRPSKLSGKGNELEFIPDLTAKKNDGKHYFEIVADEKKGEVETMSKWSLLAMLAKMRDGIFFLLVPPGNLTYTRKLIKDKGLEAEIIRIQPS